MSSLSMSGTWSAAASGRATVLLPLPGKPETTTNGLQVEDKTQAGIDFR